MKIKKRSRESRRHYRLKQCTCKKLTEQNKKFLVEHADNDKIYDVYVPGQNRAFEVLTDRTAFSLASSIQKKEEQYKDVNLVIVTTLVRNKLGLAVCPLLDYDQIDTWIFRKENLILNTLERHVVSQLKEVCQKPLRFMEHPRTRKALARFLNPYPQMGWSKRVYSLDASFLVKVLKKFNLIEQAGKKGRSETFQTK